MHRFQTNTTSVYGMFNHANRSVCEPLVMSKCRVVSSNVNTKPNTSNPNPNLKERFKFIDSIDSSSVFSFQTQETQKSMQDIIERVDVIYSEEE